MRSHRSQRGAIGAVLAFLRAVPLLLFAALALPLAAADPSTASAASMILGESAPVSPLAYCRAGPAELFETATAGGNAFAAPVAGTITSWTTTASFAVGQQMGMKVYRPLPGAADTYTVIAHDGPRGLKAGAFNTFETSIPVQAGDIVGLYEYNGSTAIPNACFYNNLVPTDYIAIAEESAADGATVVRPAIARAARPNISATLQPRPTIGSLSPASGPVAGGTQVAISGTDLENTTSVSFGGVAATAVTAVSETEILATTPPGSGPGSVEVTVRTSAGSAAGEFSYEGGSGTTPRRHRRRCVVPRLKGKRLGVARRKLKRAHCRLGRVRGARHRKAWRVAAQRPAGGKVLAARSRVSVVLGPRRHRHSRAKRH